jgi:hypothetical protein
MDNLPHFIPGIDLNRMFFQQVIRPLMDKHFPEIKYAAGILGEGSDVLRFDTPQSMDHNWGPHMRIFLTEHDYKYKMHDIDQMFRHELPFNFMGFPTNFTKPNEAVYLVQQMKPVERGPVNHMIQFYTIKSFFEHYIGFNPRKRITIKDWLTFPQQALLEVTGGEVFHDAIGLEKTREKFSYYPEAVWEYLYMIQWGRIANVETLMGRSGEVGDELGSHIIASDIATNIMCLCFLMEKKYWPYGKWFGTAFSRLRCANELTHMLLDVVHGKNWTEREEHLGRVYEVIMRMHNDLKITRPFKTEISSFEGRSYKVIHANHIYEAIKAQIKDPFFKKIKYVLGAVDQFIDNGRLTRMDYVYKEFKRIIK